MNAKGESSDGGIGSEQWAAEAGADAEAAAAAAAVTENKDV